MVRDRLNSAPDCLQVSNEELIQKRLMKKRQIEMQMRSSVNMEINASIELEERGKYSCNICDKRFFHKSSFSAHKLVHSNHDLSSSSEESMSYVSTPQKCKICKKKFNCTLKKRLHDMKYHSNEIEKEVLAVF